MEDDIIQLSVGVGDAILDSQTALGMLQNFPVIGTLVNLVKISHSIPDRLLAAKVRRMIAALERVAVTDRSKLAGKLVADEDSRRKVGEIVLLTLDKCDDLRKSDYLAYSLCAYIEEKITLIEFRRFAHAVSNSFVVELDELVKVVSEGVGPGRYISSSLRALNINASFSILPCN